MIADCVKKKINLVGNQSKLAKKESCYQLYCWSEVANT